MSTRRSAKGKGAREGGVKFNSKKGENGWVQKGSGK